MRNKQTKLMSALRPLIVKHFSEAELRALCFDLDIDYELLPGREKSEKALELIAYSKRTNALDALVQACQDTRPQIEWPQIIEKELILSSAPPTTKKKIVWLGVGLLIVALVIALLALTTNGFGSEQNNQAGAAATLPSANNSCFEAYFDDIQPDYQETVAVGESAHDFYFSDWGSKENPSLLGLRLMQSGKPIAAVRYLFQPGSSRGETAFEVVGIIDGNCQEVGDFSTTSLLIENWEHLDLELPDNAITISFNWQDDHVRFGVRQIGQP